MRAHNSTLTERVRRAGMRVTACAYRVIAVGLDRRGRFIGIATNKPWLAQGTTGGHAFLCGVTVGTIGPVTY